MNALYHNNSSSSSSSISLSLPLPSSSSSSSTTCCNMRKRSTTMLYTVSALFFLFLCFLLVHNAAIRPPSSSLTLFSRSNASAAANQEQPRLSGPTPKIVELQLGEKIVRYKKNLENLDFVDPIRRPRKIPIVKADNKINAVVDANNMKKSKKLSVDDLEPPDHLDAVKMEQDGHLNRDYKKEIFMGNHEDVDKGNKEEVQDRLQDIFEKVDVNKDKRIVESELEAWILLKVEEHFEEAEEENENVFKSLDEDTDGFITWKEFHVQFLIALGNEEEAAQKHVEEDKALPLQAEDKERLIRYKFKWAEADGEPKDNKLTMDEFKSFRHPEQSQSMLETMVQDISDNLDQNQDGIIEEDEFVALPAGEVDTQFLASDKRWQDERRREFRTTIDINHDGKVSKEELMNYVDPQNPNHAKIEARNLIELGDTNHDGKLSFTEVLDNVDLFLGSKMVDTERSFHDEF